MSETTTTCNECYYHRLVNGVRICGLQKTFIRNNTVGCYGGYKTRNIEAEQRLERSNHDE